MLVDLGERATHRLAVDGETLAVGIEKPSGYRAGEIRPLHDSLQPGLEPRPAAPQRLHAEYSSAIHIGRRRGIGERVRLARQVRTGFERFLHLLEIAVELPQGGRDMRRVEALFDGKALALAVRRVGDAREPRLQLLGRELEEMR